MVQGLVIAAGVVAGTIFLVWRWLKGLTTALDQMPMVQFDALEAKRQAAAAHLRADQHHDRLSRMEARWDAHDHEHERSEKALENRLDRIELKLDSLLDRRPPNGKPGVD